MNTMRHPAPFGIAVDVGGTFTDLVLRDAAGAAHLFKALTTPGDLSNGIFDGLAIMAADAGTNLANLLANTASFACGTTAATNAILEGKTARTALICTKGFRDVLLIREGGRPNGYGIGESYPEPFVPRELTFAVTERVDAEGSVEIPLNEDDVRAVVERIRASGAKAVAVALMWSVVNPAHELRIGALLAELLPDVSVSLSHRVAPVIGEYRRTSATALDASLKPVLRLQIRGLEERLAASGFAGQPTFVCSNGGRTSSIEITEKPVYLCLSGPSTAPAAANRLAKAAGVSHGNVITIDLGGTSLDASISRGGQVAMHREGSIGGHVFGVPSIDIATIGAGGGSIAWVDTGGMVQVGPRSAGSSPGPACYGRGGTQPTLTDANVVRGLLDPDRFADGQFRLSTDLARKAIASGVAEPLGITVEEAANLMALVAEQNMVAAIEDLAMRRGYDAREFLLVSGGAAGGLHAGPLARELGMRQLLVPRASSVLCAYGTATGDIKFDFARSFPTSDCGFDAAGVKSVLAELRREGEAFLDRMAVPRDKRVLRFTGDGHYQGQMSRITVDLTPAEADAPDAARLAAQFHAAHERLYAVSAPGDVVEFVSWAVEAIGSVSAEPEIRPASGRRERNPVRFRATACGRNGGEARFGVFDAEELTEGDVLVGPVLVQDRLTTVMVPVGATASVTAEGGLIMTFEVAEIGPAFDPRAA